MAAIVGSIEVILSTNSDAYKSAMAGAASATEQHAARMDRAVKATAGSVGTLDRSLRSLNVDAFRSLSYSALHAHNDVDRLRMSMLAVLSLAGGFAGAFVIKGLTETADTYTNIQNRLRVITDNTQHRVELERELFQSAQRTRTSIEETAKLYSRMDLAIGEHLSTKDKMRFVETVQKSFAVSGMTQSEISSNVLEITHGIDSGRIQAKTLRPLLMENVSLGKELARILAGGDLSRLREMGEEGEITSEKFVRAIIQAGDTIDKQFTRVVPTVASSLTVLNNAWTRYIGMQNESTGASHALSSGILSLADNLQTLGDHALQVGAILASLFIGRGVGRRAVSGGGAVVGHVKDIIDTRKAELAAARAAMTAADARVLDTAIAAEEASKRSSTLKSAPAFMAADPAARAAWQKQQANVDSMKAAIAEADARQTAALEKRMQLESTVATASDGAMRKQAAAHAALAAQKERLILLDERLAAAEAKMNAAGGGVSRGQMGKFYGAMGNVIAEREAFAAAERSLATAQRLEGGIRSRLSNAPNNMKGMLEANLRTNLEAQKQFAAEKLAIGAALQKAEKEFEAAEQAILARQSKDRAVATQAYLREVTKREEAMASLSAATVKAATADEAVEASRLRAHQAMMMQMNRIDAEAAAARNAGNVARGALGPAQTSLAEARAAVNSSAQKTVVGAVEAEAAAIAAANAANVAYAQSAAQVVAAEAKMSASAIALTTVWGGLRSAGAGLLGFLGGPWGAAITGIIVGLGIWEAAEMRSAAKEREHKTAVEELTVAVQKYNEAVRNNAGGFNSSQFADMAIAVEKAKPALDAVNEALRRNIAAAREMDAAMADPANSAAINFQGLSNIFEGMPQKVRDVAEAVVNGTAKYEDLTRAIEEAIRQNPGLAAQAAEVLKIARAGAAAQSALNGAAQAARNLATAMSDAELAKLKSQNEFVPHEQTDAEKEAQKWAVAIERRKKYADMKTAGDESGLRRQKMYDEAADKGMRLDKDRIAVIDAVAAAEQRAEDAEKARKKKGGGRVRKTPEQRQEEVVTNYEQRADVAMLDRMSQKFIQAAQSAKFSKDEIEKLIEALKSGGDLSGLPEGLQRLVEAEKKLEDAKWARDKIESAKTEVEKYREEVERLNRALGEGILDDKQAAQLKRAVMQDNPAYKQMRDDVDKFMEPVRSDLEKWLNGDHKAFKDFWNQMRATAIKAAMDPVWKMVSKLISEALGGMLGLGGGGGGLGGIFAGLFGGGGGGGGAVPEMAAPYHTGGTVGTTPNGLRAVPASTFAGAMRYHAGLSASEFPAILQHGERVLTASQARRTDAAIAGLAMAAGAGRAKNQIEVHNYAAGVDVQPQITPEGVIMIVKHAIDQNNRYLPELFGQQEKRR